MHQLAFITFVDDKGQDCALPAADVAWIREHPSGSVVATRGGVEIISGSTVAAMVTKIDTLWDEYTAALGDPA